MATNWLLKGEICINLGLQPVHFCFLNYIIIYQHLGKSGKSARDRDITGRIRQIYTPIEMETRQERDGRFGYKVGQDKSGTFSDQISVHLAHRAKCTEI